MSAARELAQTCKTLAIHRAYRHRKQLRRVLAVVILSVPIPAVATAAPILLGSWEQTLSHSIPSTSTEFAIGLGYNPALCVGCDLPQPLGWTGTIDFSGPEAEAVAALLTNGQPRTIAILVPGVVFSGIRERAFGSDDLRTTWDVEFFRLIVLRNKTLPVEDRPDLLRFSTRVRWEIWGTGEPAPAQVPEPSTMVLWAMGLVTVAVRRRSGNGSSDIAIAFSTANPGAAATSEAASGSTISNRRISALSTATAEAVEEAIINALIAGETMTGADSRTVRAIPHDRLREVLRKYNRLVGPAK